MDKNQIMSLVERLEYIHKRAELYISSEVLPVVNFLHGFHAACDALGIKGVYDKIYEELVVERGWQWKAVGFEDQMKVKGLDDQAIAKELLTIEIEAWRRRYIQT